jgi:hypothetical protein
MTNWRRLDGKNTRLNLELYRSYELTPTYADCRVAAALAALIFALAAAENAGWRALNGLRRRKLTAVILK